MGQPPFFDALSQRGLHPRCVVVSYTVKHNTVSALLFLGKSSAETIRKYIGSPTY